MNIKYTSENDYELRRTLGKLDRYDLDINLKWTLLIAQSAVKQRQRVDHVRKTWDNPPGNLGKTFRKPCGITLKKSAIGTWDKTDCIEQANFRIFGIESGI